MKKRERENVRTLGLDTFSLSSKCHSQSEHAPFPLYTLYNTFRTVPTGCVKAFHAASRNAGPAIGDHLLRTKIVARGIHFDNRGSGSGQPFYIIYKLYMLACGSPVPTALCSMEMAFSESAERLNGYAVVPIGTGNFAKKSLLGSIVSSICYQETVHRKPV